MAAKLIDIGEWRAKKKVAEDARAVVHGGLPPIPDGHHRVLASDGSIHDIPAKNIELAVQIDPQLKVLNP
jgi:hypothetical protein